jgi:hypothetical protein
VDRRSRRIARCQLGELMGLRITVNDGAATRDRYPDAARSSPMILSMRSHPRPDDFVVIATQHKGITNRWPPLRSAARYIALTPARRGWCSIIWRRGL